MWRICYLDQDRISYVVEFGILRELKYIYKEGEVVVKIIMKIKDE